MMSWKIKDFNNKRVRQTYLVKPFLCLAISFSIPINATDFESGKDAYHDREYEKAIEILKPLDDGGDT